MYFLLYGNIFFLKFQVQQQPGQQQVTPQQAMQQVMPQAPQNASSPVGATTTMPHQSPQVSFSMNIDRY